MNQITRARPQSIMEALETLDMKSSDTFKITASNGVILIHRKKKNGQTESLRVMANGNFQQLTKCNASDMTIKDRQELVSKMYGDKMSQTEIADLLGVSQATVSLDLRKEKAQSRMIRNI